MSMKDLMTKKRWTRPTEGKHSVVINSYRIEENDKYSAIILDTMMDKQRDYTIRMFVRNDECTDLNYLCRALMEKFGEGLTAVDYLNRAIKEKTEIDLWVYYNIVISDNGAQEYTNNYWFERTNNNNAELEAETITENADNNLPV